jgi:small subunit ribosomal protein S17
VNSILAPFGEPIDARPPVPTLEERLQEREAKRRLKEQRRREKRRAESGLPVNSGEGREKVLGPKGQEAKEAQEVQIRSTETGEESVLSGAKAEVQEEKVEGKAQEFIEEEEPKKSKSWWRL